MRMILTPRSAGEPRRRRPCSRLSMRGQRSRPCLRIPFEPGTPGEGVDLMHEDGASTTFRRPSPSYRPILLKWRSADEGKSYNRSSAPAHPPHRLPPERVAEIERLRRQRMSSPAIARQLGIPISTVTSVLRRLGLNRLKALEPPQPILRYERERPGELLHLDTKKLGRIGGLGHRITGRRTGVINRHPGIGWEYLHVCVDDASRLAYTEILADERKESAVAFLGRALVWFARHGVSVERVMTDNGNCYRSHLFRQACNDAGIRHLRTKPYTPRTNGKAERFIQTVLRECAYARPFHS